MYVKNYNDSSLYPCIFNANWVRRDSVSYTSTGFVFCYHQRSICNVSQALYCLFIYQERVTISWMITYMQLMKGSLKTPQNNTRISKAADSSSRKFWQKLYERVLLAADSNTKKAYRILWNDERLRVASVTRILKGRYVILHIITGKKISLIDFDLIAQQRTKMRPKTIFWKKHLQKI
jgi:hypothetical protein